MRLLDRNKTRCYYALYTGNKPVTDTEDRLTGEYTATYSEPILLFANVSAAKGETSTRQFGEDEAYDRTIVCDIDVPIDEYSVLWIGIEPGIDEHGMPTAWNYVVKKIAQSLNSKTIAIRKVNVGA